MVRIIEERMGTTALHYQSSGSLGLGPEFGPGFAGSVMRLTPLAQKGLRNRNRFATPDPIWGTCTYSNDDGSDTPHTTQ